MGVASCSRTRTHQYNMVAQTTLVVFTIVLAATGVFVPEAGRELEESDGNNIALNPAQTLLNSGHLVKREAKKEDGAKKKTNGRKKRMKKKKGKKSKTRKNNKNAGKKSAKKRKNSNKAKKRNKKRKGGTRKSSKKNKKRNGTKKSKKKKSKKLKKKKRKGKGVRKQKKGKKGQKSRKIRNKKNSKKSKKSKSNKTKIKSRKNRPSKNRKNKAGRKGKGKKNRKNRRKKQKLLKRLNKLKQKRKLKGRKQKQSNDSCQTLDCLNNLVQALKLEKDTVRNFLAQEKRVKAKISLLKSKQSKKGDRWDTAMYLEKRLGETKDHKFDGDGPLCKGVYNSSTGWAASELAHKLEDCNSTIEEACKSHSKVNASELAQMEVCRKKMHEYKNESEECQENPSNCTCWNDLGSKIPGIKECNTKSGSAKNAEKMINQDHKNCKKAFIACSKYEDEAIEYMIQCYTSETQIKANIKELLVIKDAATKLKTNQEFVVN